MALVPGIRFVQARYTRGPFAPGRPIGVILHRTGRANFEGLVESWRVGPTYDSGPKKGQAKRTSIHFVIGKEDGQVAQLVNTSEAAYHAGLANEYYVGIEFVSIAAPAGTPKPQEDKVINADSLTHHQVVAGRRILDWISTTHSIPLVGPPTRHEFATANGLWNGVVSHAIVANSGLFGTDHGDEPIGLDWYILGIWPKGMMR
jgi:hypothetical protein